MLPVQARKFKRLFDKANGLVLYEEDVDRFWEDCCKSLAQAETDEDRLAFTEAMEALHNATRVDVRIGCVRKTNPDSSAG